MTPEISDQWENDFAALHPLEFAANHF